MSILEDFKKVYDERIGEIRAADKKAVAAVHDVEALCDKYGIPYHASVTPLSQVYHPNTYSTLWNNDTWRAEREADPDLEDIELMEAAGCDGWPGEYEGWQHSSIC